MLLVFLRLYAIIYVSIFFGVYELKKRAIITVIILAVISAIIAVRIIKKDEPDLSGITLTVGSALDLSGGSFYEGAKLFEEEYGCTVVFADSSSECDLIFSSGEDFSACQPIDDYVNINNKLYTKQIIKENCIQDGKIYGISNVLLGNINYCTYSPEQFGSAKIPYDYYKKGGWSWDNFISMTNDINGNVAIDWTQSYINMRYALFRSENGEPTFDYSSQKQIEWLNFVRTLIYDDGIVYNTEGAFKVDFLPALILSAVSTESEARYIPLPTKSGKLEPIFVDEYHFCVPKDAQNPKLSVELANYMIKSCVETRKALYQSAMTEEDFKLFNKQLKKIYTYPPHTDYVPAQSFIDDFVHGKTVTEHIFNVENKADHIN